MSLGVGALALLLLVTPERPSPSDSLSVQVPPGVTPPNLPNSPGTSRSGVACGPGARQVPWSDYSPACEPAWHGNNGGATAPGVTPTTITVTYREALASQLGLIYTLLPPAVVGVNESAVHTLQSFADLFNKWFELYGRKVVVVPYTGQGNFVAEDIGEGQAQAQADALNAARGVHGFADMSLIDTSPLYEQALVQQQMVSFTLYLVADDFYTSASPYLYTSGPNCTKSASAIGAVAGREMDGQLASFAGDASLRSKTRSFGIIYADNPQAAECEQLIAGALQQFGVDVKEQQSILFDPATFEQSAEQIVAKMRSSGVTTIIYADADPISPIYVMGAAHAVGYHPEWLIQPVFSGGADALDAFIQNDLHQAGAPDEAAGILSLNEGPVPRSSLEALQAYRLGNGGSAAGIIPSYAFSYAPMLYLFDLLQAAGPYLTPQTLHRAMADSAMLPGSKDTTGEFGAWSFGPGTVDPAASYQVLRWNPAVASPENGQPGTFSVCDEGASFYYANNGSDVPVDVPLTCGSKAP